MKVRLFEIEPGRWIIDIPAPHYQDKIDECPVPAWLDGKRMVIVENATDELLNCECPSQIVVDADGNTSLDGTWMVNIMSSGLIQLKHARRLRRFIEAELAKEAPDVVQLMRWQQQLSKVRQLTEVEIYQIALNSLQYAPVEKPLIQQKLIDKIHEVYNRDK